ncbi:hypothetical protein ACJJTC_012967 [Scirpophaga incertulas]
MLASAKWLVLCSLWAARLVPQRTPPVRCSGGLLRGMVAATGSHVAYVGVPYATIPQRFQDPGPEPIWDGLFDAHNEHIRCIQRFSSKSISGREDCLTLNIYTPLQSSEQLRPVMVFIHGGGFRDGSGSPFLYGPEYLVKHDVILVTFNYRLEVIGFLCLGIKEAPGNVGLKDQVAALRWINKNVEAFGGDKNRVTIFGESAGSASVMYHLMSPMSRNYYQGAIMQSGSAISPWSFQFEPLKTASLLAEQLGYKAKEPHEIYKIFMSHTSEQLLRARVPRNSGDIVLSENIFVPCVDKKLPGIDQFLPDIPYNLISKGLYSKVPIIMGHNNAEGYMFAGKENDTTISNMHFYGALPRDLKFPGEHEKINTADKFKKLYMDGDEITKNTLLKFSFYEGDSCITYPVIASIDLLIKTSSKPLYSYKLSYDGWMNFAKMYFGFGHAAGATHADDLFFMFKLKLPVLLHEYMDREVIQKVTTMWTNFAKYGDPTPQTTSLLPTKWRATDKEEPRLLIIDKEFRTAPLWESETIRFWNITYAKFRRKV